MVKPADLQTCISNAMRAGRWNIDRTPFGDERDRFDEQTMKQLKRIARASWRQFLEMERAQSRSRRQQRRSKTDRTSAV